MVENVIGWALVVLIPLSVVFVLYKVKQHIKRQTEMKKQQRERALAQLKEEREESWRRLRQRAGIGKQTQVVGNNSVGIQSGGNATYNVTPATDSGFDLATMILLNSTLNSRSGAVTASVDYDTNTMTVKEEPVRSSSSWSSDDDSPSKSSSWSSSGNSGSSWDSSSSSDVGSSSSWD